MREGKGVENTRSETEIIAGLDPQAKDLLKRVLEIERARVHLKVSDSETVDELYAAVREIAP